MKPSECRTKINRLTRVGRIIQRAIRKSRKDEMTWVDQELSAMHGRIHENVGLLRLEIALMDQERKEQSKKNEVILHRPFEKLFQESSIEETLLAVTL